MYQLLKCSYHTFRKRGSFICEYFFHVSFLKLLSIHSIISKVLPYTSLPRWSVFFIKRIHDFNNFCDKKERFIDFERHVLSKQLTICN